MAHLIHPHHRICGSICQLVREKEREFIYNPQPRAVIYNSFIFITPPFPFHPFPFSVDVTCTRDFHTHLTTYHTVTASIKWFNLPRKWWSSTKIYMQKPQLDQGCPTVELRGAFWLHPTTSRFLFVIFGGNKGIRSLYDWMDFYER